MHLWICSFPLGVILNVILVFDNPEKNIFKVLAIAYFIIKPPARILKTHCSRKSFSFFIYRISSSKRRASNKRRTIDTQIIINGTL